MGITAAMVVAMALSAEGTPPAPTPPAAQAAETPAPATPAPAPSSTPSPPLKEDPSLLGRAEPGNSPSTVAASQADQPEGLGYLLFKMMLGLGVTLAAIYLSLGYVARRLSQLPASRGRLIKVVERLPLEPRRTLYVVEAAGEYLLVGGGDGPMALIARLDAEKAKATIAEMRAAASGAPKPFWLKLLERRQAEK